jgi:hypothetical protein
MAVPNTFVGGTRLFAEELNENFSNLDGRVTTASSDAANANNLTFGTVPFERLGAGSIIQVKYLDYTTVSLLSLVGTTYSDIPGYELSITPRFATSKILLLPSLFVSPSTAESYRMTMFRKIGTGSFEENFDIVKTVNSQASVFELNRTAISNSRIYLDSPDTTQEVVYKAAVKATGGGTFGVNRAFTDAARTQESSFVIMEVRA